MLILGVLGACFCIVFYLFIFALLKAADDEEPPKATPSPAPVAWAKYPVPLDKEMQLYVVEESTKRGVSPCVVFAIIQIDFSLCHVAPHICMTGASSSSVCSQSSWRSSSICFSMRSCSSMGTVVS